MQSVLEFLKGMLCKHDEILYANVSTDDDYENNDCYYDLKNLGSGKLWDNYGKEFL